MLLFYLVLSVALSLMYWARSNYTESQHITARRREGSHMRIMKMEK